MSATRIEVECACGEVFGVAAEPRREWVPCKRCTALVKVVPRPPRAAPEPPPAPATPAARAGGAPRPAAPAGNAVSPPNIAAGALMALLGVAIVAGYLHALERPAPAGAGAAYRAGQLLAAGFALLVLAPAGVRTLVLGLRRCHAPGDARLDPWAKLAIAAFLAAVGASFATVPVSTSLAMAAALVAPSIVLALSAGRTLRGGK